MCVSNLSQASVVHRGRWPQRDLGRRRSCHSCLQPRPHRAACVLPDRGQDPHLGRSCQPALIFLASGPSFLAERTESRARFIWIAARTAAREYSPKTNSEWIFRSDPRRMLSLLLVQPERPGLHLCAAIHCSDNRWPSHASPCRRRLRSASIAPPDALRPYRPLTSGGQVGRAATSRSASPGTANGSGSSDIPADRRTVSSRFRGSGCLQSRRMVGLLQLGTGLAAFREDLGRLQMQRNKNTRFVAVTHENVVLNFAVQRPECCSR